MSFKLRNMGTTGNLPPRIKRAVGRHPDGRTIVLVPDTNLATANGGDATGVAKIFVYASDNAARSNFTLVQTLTPPVAASSASIGFVGSMAVGRDGDIWIAYAGTDNSLMLSYYNWNTATLTWDAVVNQTIVAANAVTNRYKAIDIDVQWTGTASTNPAVMVFESLASDGLGDAKRVYVRLNDNVTWIEAWRDTANTTRYIGSITPDVSVCWGDDGLTANVGSFVVFYQRSYTDTDFGDTLRELTFNVATGTANSATLQIAWYTGLNRGVASWNRRGWVFRWVNAALPDGPHWIFAGATGTSPPTFEGIRLHHAQPVLVRNKTTATPSTGSSTGFNMVLLPQDKAYVSANYADDILEFVYGGFGVAKSAAARSVVMRWPAAGGDTTEYIDTNARILDGNYNLPGDPPIIGIYGGSNSFTMNSIFEFGTLIMYGEGGTNVSTTPGVYPREMRIDIEETISPPVTVSPVSTTVNKNRVTFQFSAQNATLYSDVLGLVEFQVASNAGFTTALQTLRPTTTYSSYSSSDNTTSPTRYITVQLTQAQALTPGTWYVRARMVDDLGGVSAWSANASFVVSHPPAALPLAPAEGSSSPYNSGNTVFSWNFTDPEPTDAQTAYQLKLIRTDTSAVVLDTGKVTSSVTSVAAGIASNLRDIPLSWSVSLWDSGNTQGAYSAPVNFVVSDPPVVVITSPLNAATVTTGLPTISWTFSAGGTRTQKAFRVRIYNKDVAPNQVVGDSGWQFSVNTSYTFPAQVLQPAVNYWVIVEVRDSTDQEATSESILDGNPYFEESASGWTVTPVAAVLAKSTTRAHQGTASAQLTPSGASNMETITYPATTGHEYNFSAWLYSVAGWNAVSVTIDWRNNVDASISTSVFSLTLVAGAWTKYSITGTAPAGTTGVRARINMTGAPAATDLLWVDEAILRHTQVAFITQWTSPALGNGASASTKFKATVTWTDVNQDVNFLAWRVYRRYNKYSNVDLDVENTRNTWVMIYETNVVQTSYTYNDYTAPLNRPVDYAVVQLVDRFGSAVESNLTGFFTTTLVGDRYYIVPDIPIGQIASFEAGNVTEDSFKREVEQATLHVIGRGRQVQQGDDLGYDGQLTIKLRNYATARSDREFIERLASVTTGNVWLRSPFGDVLYVAFGNTSFTRMAGTGTSDIGDLTVPYSEVFEESRITRTI